MMVLMAPDHKQEIQEKKTPCSARWKLNHRNLIISQSIVVFVSRSVRISVCQSVLCALLRICCRA